MSSQGIYADGILRVSKRAGQLGITLPSDAWECGSVPIDDSDSPPVNLIKTKFGRAIMDHIEDPNVRYVFRLEDCKNSVPDWHFIQYPNDSNMERWADIECARSLTRARYHVRETCENMHIEYTEDVTDRGVVFLDQGIEIARIAPMQFEQVGNQILIERIRKNLHHATTAKTKADLFSLFSKILDCDFEYSDIEPSRSGWGDYVVCSTLNNLSHSMKRAFSSIGLKISKGHSQELLSAFFGYESWNRALAGEKAVKNISINPVAVSKYDTVKEQHLFFVNEAEALAHLYSIFDKNGSFEVKLSATYGSLKLRQPPTRSDNDSFPISDKEDCALVCSSVSQVDRYDLDECSPIGVIGLGPKMQVVKT